MSVHATRRMTIDEFLAWQMRQEQRFELVDGQPRAIADKRISHARVAGNLLRLLGTKFRATGNPCDAFTANIAVITPAGTVRRPDIAVLCPPFDEFAMASRNPRLVAEVLSLSTQGFDRGARLDEYKAIPGLDYILIAASDVPEVALWYRDGSAQWRLQVVRALNEILDLPLLSVQLALWNVYDRVTLREPAG